MKVVLQDGIKDCGVCSLLSVIRYYGGDISKENLRELTNTNKSGVSAYDLVEAAKKIGLEATGVYGDLLKIEKNNLPCLAHVLINKSYKHFVVIYDIDLKKDKVLLMDPARGKVTVSISKFRLMSTKNFIFLRKVKELPSYNRSKIIKSLLKNFIIKEKKFIILIFILTCIFFLLQIITAFHFKYLLDFAINYHVTKPIFIISSYLLILYIFKELSNLFRDILLAKILSKLDLDVTMVTYKQVLLLPYMYYKSRTTGEVISRLKDLNTIKSFFANVCYSIFSGTIGLIMFSFILFRLHVKLSLIIIIICGILLLLQIMFNSYKKKNIKLLCFWRDKVNSYLVESINNASDIKSSHLEKRNVDIFKLKYQKFLKSNYKKMINDESFMFLKNIIHSLLITIIFCYGSYLVVKKEMSLGELLIYQNIFNYFLLFFNDLFIIFSSYHEFKVAFDRVNDLFTIREDNFIGSCYYTLCNVEGDIKFTNLNYSMNKKIFNNLSLKIKDKEHILLVGSSGVGKSTLVKILMRYIVVPYGMVSINGMDINHYHLDAIRRNVTYVSNEDSLFTDTLSNNILLGRDVSDSEFTKVLEITEVKEIINKKDEGINTLVEEGGFNFSSGEIQRIILARALIKKSSIYIFDEAFSQIDISKTRVILKNILDYLQDKTVIVISHRNNFYKLFKRVIEIKDGKASEKSKL